jgi:hypothetical protein
MIVRRAGTTPKQKFILSEDSKKRPNGTKVARESERTTEGDSVGDSWVAKL